MLLFCGFVSRNPHYNLKNFIRWWAFNVRAHILSQAAGVPLKRYVGLCALFRELSRYIYRYSGPGFD
jgi:hypothetical protein